MPSWTGPLALPGAFTGAYESPLASTRLRGRAGSSVAPADVREPRRWLARRGLPEALDKLDLRERGPGRPAYVTSPAEGRGRARPGRRRGCTSWRPVEKVADPQAHAARGAERRSRSRRPARTRAPRSCSRSRRRDRSAERSTTSGRPGNPACSRRGQPHPVARVHVPEARRARGACHPPRPGGQGRPSARRSVG